MNLMFKTRGDLLHLAFLSLVLISALADLNLTQELTEIALTSSYLSEAVGQDNPSGSDYESFQFFRQEPDAAIVAKKDGHCYGIFRYTTGNRQDRQQNSKSGVKQACENGDEQGECCTVRNGWWEAYNAPFRAEFEDALRDCASTCEDPDDCVVLGGMSQGAAIAAVAAVYLADLNPILMLIGQPLTLYPDCKPIDSSRWYRFVNTGVWLRLLMRRATRFITGT